MFADFLAFARGVADNALLSDDESIDAVLAKHRDFPVLKQPTPEIALAAHSGAEAAGLMRVRVTNACQVCWLSLARV